MMRRICERWLMVMMAATCLSGTLSVGKALSEDPATTAKARVAVSIDDQAGRLTIRVDGEPKIVYCYDDSVDLPHFDPFCSASGRPMTVKMTDPYPHHRSFWVGEKHVQLSGQSEHADVYNALYSGVKASPDAKRAVAPFRDRVTHVSFGDLEIDGNNATFSEKLTWYHGSTPVLDEHRQYRVRALGNGEYFLDFAFQLTAAYGDVTVKRDTSHYAIPYIRMNDSFNVESGGGRIVNSEGGINQEGTDKQIANWVDYHAPVDGGDREGLACFLHPSTGPPHRWLTRDYGTWGPRAPKAFHATTFTIAKGESYDQRVGLLVHHGDSQSGRVDQRYQDYCDGRL
ncbi:DUF6807 family protein [Crateriforma spongiae]|uniref:DUF6807 family protein n=1 Tax=Crateriforma spongiae TaxID=2724528 RepID=UPI001F31316B|nr:DUF6807 family protein [Crateriforma spongiae]